MKLLILAALMVVAVSAIPEPKWMKNMSHGKWGEWMCDGDEKFGDRVDCESPGENCVTTRRYGLCNSEAKGNPLGEWGEWDNCIFHIQSRGRICEKKPCYGEIGQGRAC